MVAPEAGALVDGFGRTASDLRISVTDRCNFRCSYCMPAEGLTWLDRAEILTFEEIERVARICVERFGFTGIRITGGEPTVRADLPNLVARLARLRRSDGSPVEVAMTTNGATLRLLAPRLRAAGLSRVNISLDSLRRERFAAVTRRDRLAQVLDGIDAALEVGLEPVRINTVVVRGVNDDELVDLARFGRERSVQPRFIEFMPLDADGAWSLDKVVPSAEVVERIGSVFPLVAVAHGPEPASRFSYVDGAGEIGVIASVTEPFCGDCDRVRITAEGQFRTCLFATDEHDLRALLRSGATDDDLARRIAAAVAAKWAGHKIGRVDFVRPARSMSQIGG
jgi:cyclic pyranopterin phosphate synthase